MWKKSSKNPISHENIGTTAHHPILSGEVRPLLVVATLGLLAGLISSLAICGLILLVEKVTAVPVGTFYLMVMAAITHSQNYSLSMIVSGLLLHIACGSFIGLIMAIPYARYGKSSKFSLNIYAPIYG